MQPSTFCQPPNADQTGLNRVPFGEFQEGSAANPPAGGLGGYFFPFFPFLFVYRLVTYQEPV